MRLAVGDGHNLYVEQCGNPKGVPILFVHGGPGGGISKEHRRFFDPDRFHIILFDQRGAGKSTPPGEIQNNTTWALINDIETIRKHLSISRWHLFGGSWGSTLAIAYAIRHVEKVRSLILRGIFLMTRKEISWFYQGGAGALFPEAWEKLRDGIPHSERGDLVSAYDKRLNQQADALALPYAEKWCAWEASTGRLRPPEKNFNARPSPEALLALSRIETHYLVNQGFFDTDDWLLKHLDAIEHLQCTIVHGRYDVICPVRNAWALHKRWKGSTLTIVPDAGHASSEPGIVNALVRTLNGLPT
jgi:proline iminopeptidase